MLKPHFESIQPTHLNSFLIRHFQERAFKAPFHFHPEYELTFILNGEGKRFVGNNMSFYKKWDLALIGSNLPHCWKSDLAKSKESLSESLVIQFTDDFLGTDFFYRKEMVHIRRLLQRSHLGIHFPLKTSDQVHEYFTALADEADPFRRLIQFLELLSMLARSDHYTILNTQNNTDKLNSEQRERVNLVMAYIVSNFREEVSLSEAASIARMTTNAFCKYFKRTTRRTFMETVLDYRINHATQLLIQTRIPVTQVGYESGFNDLSHFYKTFKRKLKYSPKSYRNQFINTLK